MLKIGFLVMGSQAPRILDRVMDRLDDQQFRVFLHVDNKCDLGWYLGSMRNAHRLTVVEPRATVFWGGYSMVEAEIVLIRAALADPELSTFVMLSDDTAPVRQPDVIHAALNNTPDRISAEMRDDVQQWYYRFYLPDTYATMYRDRGWWERNIETEDLEKLRQLIAAKERGKKQIGRIYFSRQWWSLSRNSIETLLNDLDQDEHLAESFRFCVMSDELMFATLYQIRFPGSVTLGVPMFNLFNPHCRTFHNTQEMAELRIAPEHLFMRKIHPDSADLVEVAAALGDRVMVAVQLQR